MDASAKKVLFDGRMLAGRDTGMGRYVSQVVRNLIEIEPADVSLQLACMDGDTPPDEMDNVVRSNRRTQNLWQQLKAPRELNDSKCDIFHYPSFDPPRLRSKILVVTCPDIEPLVLPSLFSSMVVYYYKLLIRRMRAASRIIVFSANTGDDLGNILGIEPERIEVIPLGVEPHFSPAEEERCSEVSSDYDLPDKYILYVGNTMPHKNLPRLVKAFAVVRKKHPRVGLLLAGARDKYRPRVEAAISEAGIDDAVRFICKVPEADLPALYSGASLFAFPSLYEGFGLPVLEAMACGTPVVASDAASIPEVAGDAAILVDPLDVQALAGEMIGVLEDDDKATRLSEKGIQRASLFTWRDCAEKHLAVYRELLGMS